MTGEPEFTINEQAFMEVFFRKAERAVTKTGGFVLGRARHHAPVRKIFKGTTYRASSPLMNRYRSAAGVAREVVMRRARAEQGGTMLGHANSAEPLFRLGGRRRVQGDFRLVGPPIRPDQLRGGPNVTELQLAKVPYAESASMRGTGEIRSTAGGRISAASQLSSRGRYEVRTGRGLFRTTDASTGVSTERIGGALRANIHTKGPFRVGDMVLFEVVSSMPYSRFMEFGTVHNRPYPYLRPALHESRSKFIQDARHEFTSRGDVSVG